ncbi:hypothetical protein [Luteolibacter sp. LG18]|uniref:hypothetical protein n=1 Tax=Luteolibacter sp. LG18 TaxID=2819286 RepID=UPI002B2CAB5C|nr:hypothetical protein llg_04250 [Luteolibacter sp. LG18]
MPHGSAKVEAARELWNLASRDEDPSLRFEVLGEILQAALFGGATDFFLALMPQMARLKRDHPEAVNPFTYLWRFKWLTHNLENYPEVPLDRIRQAEAEYERELRNAGGSERTAIYIRWKNAIAMGRLDDTDPLREQFLSMQRDEHADCLACEADELVRDAARRGDHAEACKRAKAILAGWMRCAEVPHLTLPHLAISAELNGEPDNALSHHRKGYPLIRSNIQFVGEVGIHMAYLAASGQIERGTRLLKTHIGWLEQNRNPKSHYHFLLGATAVCQALAGKQQGAVKLPLPSKWLVAWGDKPLSPADLAERFEQEGRTLAAAFDRRNGNSWHSDHFDQTLARIRERN